MTFRETLELLEARQVLWPNTPAPSNVEVEARIWHNLLGGYEAGVCVRAMQSFRGNAFAPNVGQLEEAIDPTPTYATALEEFRRMHARGYSTQRWSEVPWSHPLIASFAEAHFAEWGQSPDGTADPSMVQSEAAFRAHMRESFVAVRRRVDAGEISAGVRDALARSQREVVDGHGHLQVVRSAGEVGRGREDGEEARVEPDPADA